MDFNEKDILGLNQHFRYAFIGMGCANSLLLIELHKRGKLEQGQLLVIDDDEKRLNDRTFCFWITEKQLTDFDLNHLVSHKWSSFLFNKDEKRSLGEYVYVCIKSIDLYNYTRKLLDNYAVQYIRERVESKPSVSDSKATVELKDGTVFTSDWVFDSRPPVFRSNQLSDSHLIQSFIGWEVEFEHPVFDQNSFTLMDFSIEQDGHTQFMYVLPFSENRALIEVTRFGEEVISEDLAEEHLKRYISSFNSPTVRHAVERGQLPMSSGARDVQEINETWINMGTRAGSLKPSTGYSFTRSLEHANQLANQLDKGKEVQHKEISTRRFRFYDRILLMVLRDHPQKGKEIFTRLFQQNSSERILRFLDEKTTISQEVKLLLSLPILLFLFAAIKHVFGQLNLLTKAVNPAIIVSSLLIVFQFFGRLDFALYVFIPGMLLIGIPHGALDHLSLKKRLGHLGMMDFILRYLLIGAGILSLFYIQPVIGLVLFLLCSAFHFGQTDCLEWGIKDNLKSFVLGLFVLSSILFSHLPETVVILNQMGVSTLSNLSSGLERVGYFPFLMAFPLLGYIKKWQFIQLVVLLLLLTKLPLLLAFGSYFVFQHSFNGWRQLSTQLRLTTAHLWIKALPFTLGGIGLFLVYYFFFDGKAWGQFFIFAAALSLPHVWFSFLTQKPMNEQLTN